MDVAEAVLDARHDIALQAAPALLSPGFLFRDLHRLAR
jgi:hypothetical protein